MDIIVTLQEGNNRITEGFKISKQYPLATRLFASKSFFMAMEDLAKRIMMANYYNLFKKEGNG